MLDKKVSALINDQINKEFYSAYLYLAFANFYAEKGLNGFAKSRITPCSCTSICTTTTKR